MKCKSIRKHLSAFVDHELDGDLTQAISLHLETCSGCREELKRLKSVYEFIDTGDSLTDDPYFLARVRANSRAKKRPYKTAEKLEWWLARLLIPATLVVGLFVGTLLGRQFSRGILPSPSLNYEQNRDYIDRDVFSTMPDGSLAKNYLALNNIKNE